jgi:hypothetical protein
MLRPSLSLTVALVALGTSTAIATESLRFSFGPAGAPAINSVSPDTHFDSVRGFGFEPGVKIETRHDATSAHAAIGVSASRPYLFTARLPHEGNWRVTVILGDPIAPSTTTIKAELRRLMIERVG